MLRSILHCDMNNFYASVECMLDPALKKYPIAVCGSVEERHGIVLAKNYKAKAFDVKTGDAVWQAKQKCKDLVVVPPHYEEYAPTIIVAAVTAVMKKKYLPSHIILGEDFGLKKPSMVLLEQIQTVNKDELTDYIGSVNDERLWKQINAALKKTFGLWIYNTDRNGDVRCLCPKCLSDYIHDPNYVVRRLDPFAKSKDHCDKCNNSGWDYIVYDKRTSVKGKGCRNV